MNFTENETDLLLKLVKREHRRIKGKNIKFKEITLREIEGIYIKLKANKDAFEDARSWADIDYGMEVMYGDK
ncbi:MAG: hypothetical protein GXY51_02650 [Bacteroidetes bacterium]|mgnify:CR=1 FL=1|nr:hypothetical protein [Bacteroidota bacterium]